jgi:hypothetical protein
MKELHKFDNTELMDLLAKYTTALTKLIYENKKGEDYEKYKVAIKAIQKEIELRKNNEDLSSGETNMTLSPDFRQS